MQLQAVELALLGCSLSANSASLRADATSTGADAAAWELLQLVQEGKPVALLTHPAIVDILKPAHGEVSCPQDYFSWLQGHVVLAIPGAPPSGQLLYLLAGVAAYLAFLQENLTGPPIMAELGSPSQLYAGVADDPVGGQGVGQESSTVGDRAAVRILQVDGEDLQGKVSGVQWLLVALTLLVEPLVVANWREAVPAASTSRDSVLNASATEPLLSSLPSWSWWAIRAVSLNQRLLSGRSATLLKLSSELTRHTLNWVERTPWQELLPPSSAAAAIPPTWFKAAAYLEAAHVQHQYLHVEAANKLLVAAGEVLNMEVAVTGALGKRTQHQVDAKAQLVVISTRSPAHQAEHTKTEDGCVEVAQLCLDDVQPSKELEGMEENSDVFMAPQLSDATRRSSVGRSGLEQAMLLAWAQQVKKGSAADELQAWQMAPYVEALLQQQRSCYLMQLAARLLKARHEMTRNRTRERALLTLEKVVEAWQHPQPPSRLRLPLAGCTWFPLRPLLRKELAEAYITMGFVGAALKVFEQLEMWEHLIVCFRLLDKKMQADTLIRQRLEIDPNDPKLWCALGDLHLEDQHYETAWERSGKRHARSQRSLGRSAVRKKDFVKAVKHFELALQLSPLYPDAWFALGYGYLKLEEYKKALTAFTRVTQMEPDHGEAWNNVAALLLQLEKYKQAFAALSETVRYKREDWRVWENYAHAAVKCGQLLSCVHGLQQVMKLSNGQQLRMEILQQLMDAIVNLTASPSSTHSATTEPESQDEDDESSPSTAVDAIASALSQTLGLAPETTTHDEDQAKKPKHNEDQEYGDSAWMQQLTPSGSAAVFTACVSSASAQGGGEAVRVNGTSPAAGRETAQVEGVSDVNPADRSHGTDQADRSHGADQADRSHGPDQVDSSHGTDQADISHGTDQAGRSHGTDQADDAKDTNPSENGSASSRGGPTVDVDKAAKQAAQVKLLQDKVLAALHGLLSHAANSPAAKPQLWAVMAQYYELQGEMLSARESLLKQVRSLQSTPFKSEPAAFTTMAKAMTALAECYITLYESGQGSVKELASSRMQLTVFLKQTEERFDEDVLYAGLQKLKVRLQQLESIAAAR